MPQALPIIGQVALQLAAGVALSALSSALRPAQTNKPTTVTTRHGFTFELQVGENVPYSAVFGLGRASHALHYVNEYGEGDAYRLQIVHRIGIGEHDGLEQFLVDDKPVTLSGSNANVRGFSVDEFDKDGDHHLWVKVYTGAAGQAADPELDARSNPAGRWTSDSKMTGWAYLIITLRYHPDLFGSTLPTFGSVWRGLKLPDFRDEDAIFGDPSTYAFTKNPAVLKWNYRRGIYVNGVKVLGMGFPAYANDLAYYTNAANVCDELVEYPDTDEEMERYEFGREISDAEEHLSVLAEFDAAMSGTSFKRGGADAPLPGQQLISLGTLTDADLLRGLPARIDLKGSVSQKKTEWHGQYVSADKGYALVPYASRINEPLEATLGGRRSVTLDQPYERREERAQARAEIELRRQVFAGTRVETFAPKAFKYEPGDLITRTSEWGSVLMVVESADPLKDRTGVTLTLRQWSNAIVPASGEEFITLPADAAAVGDPAVRTIVVTGANVVPYSRTVSGTTLPYGRATWDQITDRNVDQVMIRYWPAAGTESADGESAFADAPLQSAKVFGPLSPNTPFTGYLIPIRKDGRTCVPVNFSFTSDNLVAGAVADETITLESLGIDLTAWQQRAANSIREVKDTLARVDQLMADTLARGILDRKQLREDLAATAGNVTASYSRAVDLLVNETTIIARRTERLEATFDNVATITITDDIYAIINHPSSGLSATAGRVSTLETTVNNPVTGLAATVSALTALTTDLYDPGTGDVVINAAAITALQAQLGNTGASATFRLDVSHTPSAGWTASAAWQVAVTAGGTMRDAGIYLESTASAARVVLAGDQVVVSNAGVVAALFEAGTTYIANARFGAFVASWAQISSAVVGNFVATTANIGSLAVDTLQIAGNAVTDLKILAGAVTDGTSVSASGGQTTPSSGSYQTILGPLSVPSSNFPTPVGAYLDWTTSSITSSSRVYDIIVRLTFNSVDYIIGSVNTTINDGTRTKIPITCASIPPLPSSASLRLMQKSTTNNTGNHAVNSDTVLGIGRPKK
jgi:hypothetical protein